MSLVFKDSIQQEHCLCAFLGSIVEMSDNSFKISLDFSVTAIKLILSVLNWE